MHGPSTAAPAHLQLPAQAHGSQDLLQQLETAVEAARRLNDRICQHRTAVKAMLSISKASSDQAHVPGTPGSHAARGAPHDGALGQLLACHMAKANSTGGAYCPPIKTEGLSLEELYLSSTGLPLPHADLWSFSSPAAGQELQRRWSELDSLHQEALTRQHKEVLQRKEQLHRMKIARLESQLRDQEERCAEQAARADALAAQLDATQAMLKGARAVRGD